MYAKSHNEGPVKAAARQCQEIPLPASQPLDRQRSSSTTTPVAVGPGLVSLLGQHVFSSRHFVNGHRDTSVFHHFLLRQAKRT